MKFWLTVIVGVVVVALVSTYFTVVSPSAVPAAAPKVQPEPVDPSAMAVAEIVSPQKYVHEGLGQNQTGQDIFKIKNSGKAPLTVIPVKPTCICTDMFLSESEPKETEPAPTLEKQLAEVSVQPGKTVNVVARWNTKGKLSKQDVTVPVRLENDPRKREIHFRIELDIHKEIVQSVESLEFGMLNEGQKKTVSATITSLIRDKFEIAKLESSSKWFKAKAIPLTGEELKAAGAKSGYRVEVSNDGANPVGSILDVVVAEIKSPKTTERVQFNISGRVLGDMETDLKGDVIAFNEVTAETYRPKKVTIFARNMKDGDSFRIGTVKPVGTVAAKIEKNPKVKTGKAWNLAVEIPPTAPGGKIENGSISIVDSTGRERLVFRVTGLIDPNFARTASR
jgi:hypothetical protein